MIELRKWIKCRSLSAWDSGANLSTRTLSTWEVKRRPRCSEDIEEMGEPKDKFCQVKVLRIDF